MDKNLQKDFLVHHAWGMSCMLDVRQCNMEKLVSRKDIQDYVIQLCKLLEIERIGDLQIVNVGTQDRPRYAITQLVETSFMTAHFSDIGTVFVDIFACKAFDANAAAEFTKSFFEGSDVMLSSKIRK
jgi:hypothetical protein